MITITADHAITSVLAKEVALNYKTDRRTVPKILFFFVFFDKYLKNTKKIHIFAAYH